MKIHAMTFTIPFPTPQHELEALNEFLGNLNATMNVLNQFDGKYNVKLKRFHAMKRSCLRAMGMLALKGVMA